MTNDDETAGRTDERESWGRQTWVRMLTVGQMRVIVADPALDDSTLIVIDDPDPDGDGAYHISDWQKPNPGRGDTHFALHLSPGERLDTRDY